MTHNRSIEPRDIMRYYVAYNDIEKDIIKTIKSKELKQREDAYNKYVHKYMRIGRNFKPKSFSMVLATVENMLRNEGNLGVEELSNRYVKNELVSKSTIKKVEVAASKLLWIYDRETIIMDNNNMIVLKAKNYADYVEKWTTYFDKKLIEIENVIDSYFKNIDSIMNEKWFKMRVFDMYLLSLYSESKLL